MMVGVLENVGFVEPEGETLQILSRSKSDAPSRALLISVNAHPSPLWNGPVPKKSKQ
jgi:hypothetical protein